MSGPKPRQSDGYLYPLLSGAPESWWPPDRVRGACLPGNWIVFSQGPFPVSGCSTVSLLWSPRIFFASVPICLTDPKGPETARWTPEKGKMRTCQTTKLSQQHRIGVIEKWEQQTGNPELKRKNKIILENKAMKWQKGLEMTLLPPHPTPSMPNLTGLWRGCSQDECQWTFNEFIIRCFITGLSVSTAMALGRQKLAFKPKGAYRFSVSFQGLACSPFSFPLAALQTWRQTKGEPHTSCAFALSSSWPQS